MSTIEKMYSSDYGGTVEIGGTYVPRTCAPRARVALIIPYRNRPEQLKIFLRHIHPILQRFGNFICDYDGFGLFNCFDQRRG